MKVEVLLVKSCDITKNGADLYVCIKQGDTLRELDQVMNKKKMILQTLKSLVLA